MSRRRPVVLLVDDEANVLSALRRALRREGYELLAAGSAEEALRLLEEQPVDLVLSDQKMPGTSGLELLRRVAARHPRVARLLITGWPEEVPQGEREALGLRALLPKPWDTGELRAALRRSL